MITEEMIKELGKQCYDNEVLESLANELISSNWNDLNITKFIKKPDHDIYKEVLNDNLIDLSSNDDSNRKKYVLYQSDPNNVGGICETVVLCRNFRTNYTKNKMSAIKIALCLAYKESNKLNKEKLDSTDIHIPLIQKNLSRCDKDNLRRVYYRVHDSENFCNNVVTRISVVKQNLFDESFSTSNALENSVRMMDYFVVEENEEFSEYAINICSSTNASEEFEYDRFACKYKLDRTQLKEILTQASIFITSELNKVCELHEKSSLIKNQYMIYEDPFNEYYDHGLIKECNVIDERVIKEYIVTIRKTR